MYRQFEKEQQEQEERNTQSNVSAYSDKEDSYDETKMDNMQMPCSNLMGTGIKMQINGRPMMCYPIMNEGPTMYDPNMGDGGMHHCPGMFRQPNEMYHNEPQMHHPMRPFFPFIWYNYYPMYPQYPHYPHYPHYPQYPMHPMYPMHPNYPQYPQYPQNQPYQREEWD